MKTLSDELCFLKRSIISFLLVAILGSCENQHEASEEKVTSSAKVSSPVRRAPVGYHVDKLSKRWAKTRVCEESDIEYLAEHCSDLSSDQIVEILDSMQGLAQSDQIKILETLVENFDTTELQTDTLSKMDLIFGAHYGAALLRDIFESQSTDDLKILANHQFDRNLSRLLSSSLRKAYGSLAEEDKDEWLQARINAYDDHDLLEGAIKESVQYDPEAPVSEALLEVDKLPPSLRKFKDSEIVLRLEKSKQSEKAIEYVNLLIDLEDTERINSSLEYLGYDDVGDPVAFYQWATEIPQEYDARIQVITRAFRYVARKDIRKAKEIMNEQTDPELLKTLSRVYGANVRN